MIVVSPFPIHVMSEYWYHVFVRIGIKVVHFVAFVENIGHYVRWRCVDNRRRDDIRHIPGVLVFGNLKFFVGVEPAYCTEMYIASKDGDTDRFSLCNMLQLFDEPIPFLFVMFCRPVIVKIVEYLDTAVELINKATKHAGTTHSFDGVHQFAC